MIIMTRLIALLGFVAFTTGAFGANVPTPDLAISFRIGDDPRPWKMVFTKGNREKIIAEFTIGGESIERWSEMVAQEIAFGRLSLSEHFNQWKAMLRQADPKIVMTEKQLPDGSLLATYESTAFDELSVRRFMKGGDGVYMVAYHARHRSIDPERWKLWTTIVSESSLIPNPVKTQNKEGK